MPRASAYSANESGIAHQRQRVRPRQQRPATSYQCQQFQPPAKLLRGWAPGHSKQVVPAWLSAASCVSTALHAIRNSQTRTGIAISKHTSHCAHDATRKLRTLKAPYLALPTTGLNGCTPTVYIPHHSPSHATSPRQPTAARSRYHLSTATPPPPPLPGSACSGVLLVRLW